MAVLHYFGAFLIFGAFALMLIVSVGVPIWNQIDFMNALDRQYLLGIWGASIAGTQDVRTYGYIATVDVANQGQTILLNKGLSYALILNPIAAGFALIALFAAFFSNTACGILASLLSFWAFLVCLAALAVDLAAFIMARNRFNNATGGNNPQLQASLGKAMWFVVASTGALLLASLTVCFTHSSHKKRKNRDIEERPLNEKRGFFGRRKNNRDSLDHSEFRAATHDQNTLVGNEDPVMHQKKQHFWSKKQPAY